jgi:hypothetical protein
MQLNRYLPLILAIAPALLAEDILIVADEVPAMEVLAKQFQSRANLTSKIVLQTAMPDSLKAFKTVAVYIHKDINEGPEHAFLDYLKDGGKLLLLHHSISSGKRKNKAWLPAFEITLPTAKFDDGGYAYFDPATFDVVNLAPTNFVTTHDVTYPKKVAYAEKQLDGFTVPDTEIYLNHQFDGPRTKLLGLKWTEPKSGRTYMQDTVGWQKKVGKGEVYYFMVGHKAADFDIPAYAQILTNAVMAK